MCHQQTSNLWDYFVDKDAVFNNVPGWTHPDWEKTALAESCFFFFLSCWQFLVIHTCLVFQIMVKSPIPNFRPNWHLQPLSCSPRLCLNESAPGFCPVAFRATVRAISVAVKASVVAINSLYLTNRKSHISGNVLIVMLNCSYDIYSDFLKCQVNVFRSCLINPMASENWLWSSSVTRWVNLPNSCLLV